MDGYRVIDRESYYRKGVFRHFSEDCKCSMSMTARLDVTELAARSKDSGTRFSLNFSFSFLIFHLPHPLWSAPHINFSLNVEK